MERPLASGTALLLIAILVAAALALDRPARSAMPAGSKSPARLGSISVFSLLLVALGALLTLFVEFAYLGDVFGTRMNTVFKLYFQAWVVWAIACAYGLASLLDGAASRATGSKGGLRASIVPALRRLGIAVAGLLIAGGTVYTPFAISARAREYGAPPTLDGAAHLAARDAGDYDAIRWLNDTVAGAPVILEAHGGSYEYSARISAHTGLPTVLGWSGHERQWRGGTEQQAGREEDIDAIYAANDAEMVRRLLDKYDVEYVIVGDLERSHYDSESLDRLTSMLSPVFTAGTTKVYQR
jgi:YYY domain-containing protein